MSDVSVGQLVGFRDRDLDVVDLVAWQSGPAGVATATVAHGLATLSFDFAEPELLTSAEVLDPASPEVVRALGAVLGVDAELLLDRVTDQRRVVWTFDELNRRRPATRRVHANLHRAALLRADIEELTMTELGTVVALLELAATSSRLPTEVGISPAPISIWQGAQRRITDLHPGEVDALNGLSTQTHRQLLSYLNELTAALGRSARPTADLIDHLTEKRVRRPPATVLESAIEDVEAVTRPAAMAEPSPAAASQPELDVITGPAAPADVLTTRRIGSHIDVTIRANVDLGSLWLRVFETTDEHPTPVLVALAPLAPQTFGTAHATALVSPSIDTTNLLVDVHDSISDPPLRATGPTIKAAIALGRRATRAARRGKVDTARETWHECAGEWARLDDPRRAQIANDYANGQRNTNLNQPHPGTVRSTGRTPRDFLYERLNP